MSHKRMLDIEQITIASDGTVMLSDLDLALIERVDFGKSFAGAGGGTNSGDCGGLIPNLGCHNAGNCTGVNDGCSNTGRCA